MNLNQLAYFEKIAEYNSINKAAKYLYMTPSSLSTALNNLEKELGYQLFHRSNAGLFLTANGKNFLQDVQTILKLEEKWKLISANTLIPAKETVNLAVIPAIYNSIAGDLVLSLTTMDSSLTVNVSEKTVLEINSCLLKNEADFAILSYNVAEEESIEIFANNLDMAFYPLYDDVYAVYVGREHPLYTSASCTAAQLKDFIGVSLRHNSINKFDSQRFFRPESTLYFYNQIFALQKVAASTCYAILPKILKRNYYCQAGFLHALDFPEEIMQIKYALIAPQKYNLSAPQKLAIDTILDYFQALPNAT